MFNLRVVPLAAAVLALSPGGLAPVAANAQSATPAQIAGTWEAEDGSIKIAIFDEGGSYSGRVIYGRLLVESDNRTFKKDVHNPDASLRTRSLQGVVLLKGLKWNSKDSRWDGGSFYQAPTGRTLDARAGLSNGLLELRIYRGTPMLGGTLKLRRVNS